MDHTTMNFRFSSDAAARLPGLAIFEKALPARFGAGGANVHFESGRERPGFSVTHDAAGHRVRYMDACDAYRAVGLLLSGVQEVEQDRAHASVGVMWDLSRNGVLRVEAWEELLQKFALMGINSVQLYMEDVYAIPDEPFFGYGRGAYTKEELRRIDASGRALGIEVVPCIQTLGHLEQVLQWPAYGEISDVPAVLLADADGTRQLIGRMLDTVAECFQTRTVHIGMDEAHGIGTGRFLTKHGWQRPFDILARHLEMVVALCRERNLKPMMWSDMFFRIGSSQHNYYDRNASIPPEIVSRIPADVDLVYWDYHHSDPAFYTEWIRRHRAMGKEPVFATGAWSWGRFWTYAPRWRESLSAGMKAARDQELSKTFLTIWGDDGDEYHPASTLPAVQFFAEWAYAGVPDDQALARQFAIISDGASLADYLAASQLDESPAVRGFKECAPNPSKWILWHDPILGFLNAHIMSDLPTHWNELAVELDHPHASEPIRFAAMVARAVALKAELHLKVRPAWKAGQTTELHRLRNSVLPNCLQAVRALWEAHRKVWRQWKKPFGWEVIELRYAGCVARLESLETLLDECLKNPKARIPEWEYEPLSVAEMTPKAYFNHGRAATPSVIR